MSEEWKIYLCGVFSGIWLTLAAISFAPGPFKQAKVAIAVCEENLPRNERCVVTAIPKVN